MRRSSIHSSILSLFVYLCCSLDDGPCNKNTPLIHSNFRWCGRLLVAGAWWNMDGCDEVDCNSRCLLLHTPTTSINSHLCAADGPCVCVCVCVCVVHHTIPSVRCCYSFLFSFCTTDRNRMHRLFIPPRHQPLLDIVIVLVPFGVVVVVVVIVVVTLVFFSPMMDRRVVVCVMMCDIPYYSLQYFSPRRVYSVPFLFLLFFVL